MVYTDEPNKTSGKITAEEFLTGIKEEQLSEREFIALIGHTKLSNEDYAEIKETPDLTFSRLLEIFENSPLDGEDYTRLLETARERKRKRTEVAKREKLESELKTVLRVKTNGVNFSYKRERKSEYLTDEITLNSDEAFGGETESITEADLWGDDSVLNDINEIDYSDELNEYGGNEDFDENAARANRFTAIVCLFLCFAFVFGSFLTRYITTGAWLIDQWAFRQPESYEDFFSIVSELSLDESKIEIPEAEYKAYPLKKDGVKPLALCHNANYIFKVIKNEIVAVKIASGKINPPLREPMPVYGGENEEVLSGIFLQSDKLYAVYSGEYEININYQVQDETTGRLSAEISTLSFKQPRVIIRAFDALNWNATPVTEYAQDGILTDVIIRENNFFLITGYSVQNSVYKGSLDGYIPAYSLGTQRNYVPFENIYLSEKFNYSNFTVISSIGGVGDTGEYYAIAGEIADFATLGENTLTLVFTGGGETLAVKYGVYENKLISPVAALVKGDALYGGADVSGGILRLACVIDGESGVTLYVLSSEMTQLSRVSNIAAGKERQGITFDSHTVYIIAEELFAVDTTDTSAPKMLKETNALITSEHLYLWGEDGYLSVKIEADETGRRQAVKLEMYKHDGDAYILRHTALLSARNTITEGWNDYLRTEAETNPYSTAADYESGIIVVPYYYRDVVSEVERFAVLKYDEDEGFTEKGDIIKLDQNNKELNAVYSEGYIYAFFGNMIMSAATDTTIIDMSSVGTGENEDE